MENKVENLLDKIEAELSKVQKTYYEQERYVPERFEKFGLDNIVGNACLYDISYFASHDDKDKAWQYANDTEKYLDRILYVAEGYKPTYGICSWRGFVASIYYPLYRAHQLIKHELMPQLCGE